MFYFRNKRQALTLSRHGLSSSDTNNISVIWINFTKNRWYAFIKSKKHLPYGLARPIYQSYKNPHWRIFTLHVCVLMNLIFKSR